MKYNAILRNIKKLKDEDILKDCKPIDTKNNLMCICPFHEESKPSFSINLVSGKYQCFSCGASGVSFESFFDRIKSRYSIKLLEYKGSENFIQMTNEYIQSLNIENNEIEKTNIKYLNEEVLNKYSSELGEYICDRVHNKNIREMFEIKYDNYNKRYVIPIRNYNKRLCGIVFRQFKDPKYLYNFGFNKKLILFGLDKIDKSCDRAIIVEGSLDVIKTYDNGVVNSVAILGSKMSKHQEDLILRNFNEVIIATDNDKAGSRCADDIQNRLKNKIKLKRVSWITKKKDFGELQEKELMLELNNCIEIL